MALRAEKFPGLSRNGTLGTVESNILVVLLFLTLHRFPSLPATTFIAFKRNVTFQKPHGQGTGNTVRC